MNYTNALYRRNNKGRPCYWMCSPTGEKTLEIRHGIVGMAETKEYIETHRNAKDECESRIKAKRKSGYKYLSEIKDSDTLPVEGELYTFLDSYLPTDRTTSDGMLLPMLAKAYDNKNNKLFAKAPGFLGQWKVNGLRCHISAKKSNDGLFEETRLIFMSREGTIWSSLANLEEYLLNTIPNTVLNKMLDEYWTLDGELYLPGFTVNDINHFVKDPKSPFNAKIQFWCYDLAIEDTIQSNRNIELLTYFNKFTLPFITNKDTHLSITSRLNILPTYSILDETAAIAKRDMFIQSGFEGLIMRNPHEEYQFGKRNLSMIKFKSHDDGLFEIISLRSEGVKRPDIPLFLCRNDINDATFEVSISGTLDYQRQCLRTKDSFIGKKLFIEYGERSGVNQLPFHVKLVKLHNV